MSNLKNGADRYEEFAAQFGALAEQLRRCGNPSERIELLEKTLFLIRKADELIADYEKELLGKVEGARKASA